MTQTAAIRPVTSPADLSALVGLVNEVTPDDPTSLEGIRWSDATYPGTTRFLAEVDGRVVGLATVGRIYVFAPEYPAFWASIVVAPDARRQGTGGALLRAVSERASTAGKTGLLLRGWEHRPEGIAFLEHRGFSEFERAQMLRLELAGLPAPAITMPDGVLLTDLAARPDLVVGVHAVAVEVFDDIPGGDQPMAVGDLVDFRARDVDRPGIPPEAFMIAVDAASDEVIGYASLLMAPGSDTVAWHDMTGVRRTWRGRGIAIALKRATIAWAIHHGLSALEAGNDEANAGMRAVNAKLGYQPLPDSVIMRGPLVGVGS